MSRCLLNLWSTHRFLFWIYPTVYKTLRTISVFCVRFQRELTYPHVGADFWPYFPGSKRCFAFSGWEDPHRIFVLTTWILSSARGRRELCRWNKIRPQDEDAWLSFSWITSQECCCPSSILWPTSPALICRRKSSFKFIKVRRPYSTVVMEDGAAATAGCLRPHASYLSRTSIHLASCFDYP